MTLNLTIKQLVDLKL